MNIPVKADISFGDVCFSWEKHNAIVKEHDIGLTMTEFSLLGCLMEHGGTAIPGMKFSTKYGNRFYGDRNQSCR